MTQPETNKTLQHPHLRQVATEVETVTTGVEQLREAYSVDQLVWKPNPETWNMLECIEHLRISGALYYPRIQAAIQKAATETREQAFRPGFLGKKFIASMRPEATRKVKTFRIFKPAPALKDISVLDRFLEQQQELTDLLQQADGVNINSSKLSSPLSRLIRFTVGEALTFLVVHQRRHLQQARNLTARPDFPVA